MDKNSSVIALILIFLCVLSIGMTQYALQGTLRLVLTFVAIGILLVTLVVAITSISRTPSEPSEKHYSCVNGKCVLDPSSEFTLAECQFICAFPPPKPGEQRYKCVNGKCVHYP